MGSRVLIVSSALSLAALLALFLLREQARPQPNGSGLNRARFAEHLRCLTSDVAIQMPANTAISPSTRLA